MGWAGPEDVNEVLKEFKTRVPRSTFERNSQ